MRYRLAVPESSRIPVTRRIAIAVIALLSVWLPLSASAESTYAPGDPYTYISAQEPGQHNIYFHDGVGSHGNGGFGNHSFLVNMDIVQTAQGRPTVDPTCTSLDSGSCASAKDIQWNSQLPQCSGSSDANCISGFGIINADNSKIAARFQSYFPSKAQNAFTGDVSKKIPTGATSNVYALTSSAGTITTFMVSSFLSGIYHRSENKNELAGFNLSITPVMITPARNPGPCITNETGKGPRGEPCHDDGYVRIPSATSPNSYFYGEASGAGADCGEAFNRVFATANFDKLCASEVAFPSLDKYYVTLRLNNPPNGWMHGRLSEPVISTNQGTNGSEYEFVGKPVLVPLLYKSNYWKDLPDSITSQYEPTTGQFKGSNCDGAVGRIMSAEEFKDPLKRNFTAMPCPSGALSIKELNLWLPLLKNQATATPALWNVRTITPEEAQGANQCFKDPKQITGIVTTNSTNYTSGPPAFNKATGELNYQVAAPHFLQDGTTPFKGIYNLVMRSDVARCIYGFTNAPISGSISVISEGGEQQIATTVVGEKNGWMYLSAVNFEFSSPKLRIKLTQPSAKAQVTSKTILCVKGKVTKKVTGVAPSCPKGYTRK